MNKEINIDNKIYKIQGCWDNHLALKWFKGSVYDINDEEIMDLDFRIPLSAIVKFGLPYFEECIENDLKIEIANLNI